MTTDTNHTPDATTATIMRLVDTGHEDVARDTYGDAIVDRTIANEWGIDIDAMRTGW